MINTLDGDSSCHTLILLLHPRLSNFTAVLCVDLQRTDLLRGLAQPHSRCLRVSHWRHIFNNKKLHLTALGATEREKYQFLLQDPKDLLETRPKLDGSDVEAST